MKLIKIEAEKFQEFFGLPMEPITQPVVGFAQELDCSSFYYLVEDDFVHSAYVDVSIDDITNAICIFDNSNNVAVTPQAYSVFLKQERAIAMENVKVIVNSKEFDGDEISQTRMARTVLTMNDSDTVQWKLANKEFAQVTKAELTEVIKLASETQTAIWVKYA